MKYVCLDYEKIIKETIPSGQVVLECLSFILNEKIEGDSTIPHIVNLLIENGAENIGCDSKCKLEIIKSAKKIKKQKDDIYYKLDDNVKKYFEKYQEEEVE